MTNVEDEKECLTAAGLAARPPSIIIPTVTAKKKALTILEKVLILALVVCVLVILALMASLAMLITTNTANYQEGRNENSASKSIAYRQFGSDRPRSDDDVKMVKVVQDVVEVSASVPQASPAQDPEKNKATTAKTTMAVLDSEEEEADLKRLEEDARLGEIWADKIAKYNHDFSERYRRDEYSRMASRRLFDNLPRPSRFVSGQSPVNDGQKVDEILYSLDGDNDGAADPFELLDWIQWVEKVVYRHILDEQWAGLGRSANKTTLSWPDYQHILNPHGVRDLQARLRVVRERRRWRHADNDLNEELTKHEFKYFLLPQLSPDGGLVLVPEAHADLDANHDGRVELGEFLAIHEPELQEERARYFNETLDADGNGLVDVLELAMWVEPDGFVQAKSEVVHLMEKLDWSGDKVLTRQEIVRDPEVFLSSQATFFGRVYQLENLRNEVFQLNN